MSDEMLDIAMGVVVVAVLSGLVGGSAYLVFRLITRWFG